MGAEKGCSDDITIFAIKDFNNDISNNVFISIVIFIFAIYAFFCNVIVILLDSWYSGEDEKFTYSSIAADLNLKIFGKAKIAENFGKVELIENFNEVSDVDKSWEKILIQNDDENQSLFTNHIDSISENSLNNSQIDFKPDLDKIAKIDY